MINLNDVLLAMSNIPVDDPIAEIWGRGLQGGGYTIIEYTGALPITINANGEPLIDYRIYGNTEQAGTPTPENPIMPIGCGERFDITGLSEPLCGIETYTDSLDLSTGILTRRIKKLVLTGEEKYFFWSDNTYGITDFCFYLPTDVETAICTHLKKQTTSISQTTDEGYLIESIGDQLSMFHIRISRFSTEDELKEYLALQYRIKKPVTIWYVLAESEVSTIPVPSGLTGVIEGYLIQDGTPTPRIQIYPTANGVKQADDTYSIPYYKLPILSNSTVTNIYLGEVETTRRIKKLVLTGEENCTESVGWKKENTSAYYVSNIIGILNQYVTMLTISTHFLGLPRSVLSNIDNAGACCPVVRGIVFRVLTTDMPTVSDFKSFLATQYAAGTPVTVWYVLAEPETGIVNEPLMKIGDYADTIDNTQTSVQIPTFAGTTVIDYDGTTKPSQMYIKYLGVKK